MTNGPDFGTVIVNDEQSLWHFLVIYWRDRLWIVPEWIELPGQKQRRPARLICLNSLHYREHRDRPYRYSLIAPIPRSVLDGSHPAPQVLGFEVVEAPDIAWPLQGRPHEPSAL